MCVQWGSPGCRKYRQVGGEHTVTVTALRSALSLTTIRMMHRLFRNASKLSTCQSLHAHHRKFANTLATIVNFLWGCITHIHKYL